MKRLRVVLMSLWNFVRLPDKVFHLKSVARCSPWCILSLLTFCFCDLCLLLLLLPTGSLWNGILLLSFFPLSGFSFDSWHD
jgi:hypothetical protein